MLLLRLLLTSVVNKYLSHKSKAKNRHKTAKHKHKSKHLNVLSDLTGTSHVLMAVMRSIQL